MIVIRRLNLLFSSFAAVIVIALLLSPLSLNAITIEDAVDSRAKAGSEKKSPAQDITESSRDEVELDLKHEYKDPRLACLLSVMMPGAGHIYLRQDLKGGGFCLLTGVSYSLAGYYIFNAMSGSGAEGDLASRFTIPGIFIFLSAAVHVVAIVEAHADAEEFNKRIIIYGTGKKRVYRAKIIIEK